MITPDSDLCPCGKEAMFDCSQCGIQVLPFLPLHVVLVLVTRSGVCETGSPPLRATAVRSASWRIGPHTRKAVTGRGSPHDVIWTLHTSHYCAFYTSQSVDDKQHLTTPLTPPFQPSVSTCREST